MSAKMDRPGCIAMTDKLPLGSTGNKGPVTAGFNPTISHDGLEARHTVVIEGNGEALMAGDVPLQKIIVDGKYYTHVGEDDEGRWVYRPL